MHWLKILEKLRKDQGRSIQEDRPVLHLPVPPYEYDKYPALEEITDISERGVWIIEPSE